MNPIRSALVILTLVVALSPSSPAQAQSIGAGTIIALRAPNGGWLSAKDDGMTLSIVTRDQPTAWEQWEYAGTASGCQFKSFHGTCLLANAATPQATHGASWSQDSSPIIFVSLDPNGARLQRPLASGDKVIIAINYPVPQGTNVPLSLRADGANVTWAYTNSINNFGEHPENFTQWTAIVPQSPASGRVPMRTVVNENIAAYKFVNNNGRVLSQGADLRSGYPPVPAAQATNGATLSFGYTELYNSRPPLVYNKPYVVNANAASNFALTGFPNGERGSVLFGGASQKWLVVDPTGRAAPGSRVPMGATVCIKMEGAERTLSADPGNTTIFPSYTPCNPNGIWEHWTILAK